MLKAGIDLSYTTDLNSMFARFGKSAVYRQISSTSVNQRTGFQTKSSTSIPISVITELVLRKQSGSFVGAEMFVHVRTAELPDTPESADEIDITIGNDTVTYNVIASRANCQGTKWTIGVTSNA